MIFLRINWPSFNLKARMLRSCIHLLHYFNTICPRPKNGTSGILVRPRLGHGKWGQDTGRPGKYGMVGNPSSTVLTDTRFQLDDESVRCEVSVVLVQGCEWHWLIIGEALDSISFPSDGSMQFLQTPTQAYSPNAEVSIQARPAVKSLWPA